MATKNPKISAYVPPVIYKKLKQFQNKEEITMSQAIVVILSEYFALKQEEKEAGVLERLKRVESEIAKMKVAISASTKENKRDRANSKTVRKFENSSQFKNISFPFVSD